MIEAKDIEAGCRLNGVFPTETVVIKVVYLLEEICINVHDRFATLA